MPHSSFVRLNEESQANGTVMFSNPRNATAGTLRQLDPSFVSKRGLKVFVYDILASSDQQWIGDTQQSFACYVQR
jgi:DNA ligase (NAD+)